LKNVTSYNPPSVTTAIMPYIGDVKATPNKVLCLLQTCSIPIEFLLYAL
jgi:hypothetical protein